MLKNQSVYGTKWVLVLNAQDINLELCVAVFQNKFHS